MLALTADSRAFYAASLAGLRFVEADRPRARRVEAEADARWTVAGNMVFALGLRQIKDAAGALRGDERHYRSGIGSQATRRASGGRT